LNLAIFDKIYHDFHNFRHHFHTGLDYKVVWCNIWN